MGKRQPINGYHVEIRTEFPALEDRKSYLEHAAYEATRQSNDAVFAGKPDNAVQQHLFLLQQELEDINYVLRYFEMLSFRSEQDWKQWQTIVLIMVAMLALGLSLYSIWRG